MSHGIRISPVPELIEEITAASNHRKALVKARTNLTLQLKAKARGLARTRVQDTGEVISDTTGVVSPEAIAAAEAAYPALSAARDILKAPIAELEKEIKSLVHRLPVWYWAASMRGIGEVSLGAIIAGAGDLAEYRNEAALWKRFGLGLVVHEGKSVCQRRSTDPQLAQVMGYSPHRRALMHSIGATMVRTGGPYAEYYRDQKIKILERYPGLSRVHLHKRALRKMEKKFLSDLYHEWCLST